MYAYSVAEGSAGLRLLVEEAVLAFQLGCIIPIITQKYFYLFGFFAVGFHVSVVILMGIPFELTAMAAFLFLIVAPEMQKIELKMPTKLEPN